MNALLPSDSRLDGNGLWPTTSVAVNLFFIRVDGNLQSPVTLHGLEALTAKLERIDGIYDVMHVGVLLERTYEGWLVDADCRQGGPSIDAFGLLTGAPMISQLITGEYDQGFDSGSP